MTQRVRHPYRGQSPSSVTQLPILTALHAGKPTLFFCIIHDLTVNVNREIEKTGRNCLLRSKNNFISCEKRQFSRLSIV